MKLNVLRLELGKHLSLPLKFVWERTTQCWKREQGAFSNRRHNSKRKQVAIINVPKRMVAQSHSAASVPFVCTNSTDLLVRHMSHLRITSEANGQKGSSALYPRITVLAAGRRRCFTRKKRKWMRSRKKLNIHTAGAAACPVYVFLSIWRRFRWRSKCTLFHICLNVRIRAKCWRRN